MLKSWSSLFGFVDIHNDDKYKYEAIISRRTCNNTVTSVSTTLTSNYKAKAQLLETINNYRLLVSYTFSLGFHQHIFIERFGLKSVKSSGKSGFYDNPAGARATNASEPTRHACQWVSTNTLSLARILSYDTPTISVLKPTGDKITKRHNAHQLANRNIRSGTFWDGKLLFSLWEFSAERDSVTMQTHHGRHLTPPSN